MLKERFLPGSMDSADLPTTEQFFEKGTDNGLCRNCAHCCWDSYHICCEPQPCCHPKENALCLTIYNCCAGSSAGVFIYPLWCPCGCATCCCPTKICDVLCCCCASPEERCDSMRYIGQRFLVSGMANIEQIYPYPPGTDDTPVTEADAYKGEDGPSADAYPNQFVSFFEALGDLLTSLACLAPLCIGFVKNTVAPNTTWQPASKYVGQHDSQMNDNENFGGAWIFPSKFDALPTPPGALDDDGNELPTNVAAGEVGSRVIFWAHGSAFAITQAKDFVWLFGQMLSEQTGQVVLLGEYALTSDTVYPSQLDQWTATYTMLCNLYGSRNVIIAGDSAGGCLALATLLNTTDSLPPPGGLALFSPWVDLCDGAITTTSMQTYCPENGALKNYGTCDYLPVNGVSAVSAAYANSANRGTPLVSPYLASADQLAPLAVETVGDDGVAYTMQAFVTWGEAEVLRDQQTGLAQKLEDAGISVTGYASPNMPHDSAVIAASLLYNTGLGFQGVGDYSNFEPTRTWVQFFTWLKEIPGWEGTQIPEYWLSGDATKKRMRVHIGRACKTEKPVGGCPEERRSMLRK